MYTNKNGVKETLELIKKYWFAIMALFVLFMFIEQAACLLMLGTILIYAFTNAFLFLKKIKKIGIHAQGKILRFESDHDGYKTPVIEFKTSENVVIEGNPYVNISTSLSTFRTYKNVTHQPESILYLPSDPNKFVVESKESQNYAGTFFFLIVGIILLGMGVAELSGAINLF